MSDHVEYLYEEQEYDEEEPYEEDLYEEEPYEEEPYEEELYEEEYDEEESENRPEYDFRALIGYPDDLAGYFEDDLMVVWGKRKHYRGDLFDYAPKILKRRVYKMLSSEKQDPVEMSKPLAKLKLVSSSCCGSFLESVEIVVDMEKQVGPGELELVYCGKGYKVPAAVVLYLSPGFDKTKCKLATSTGNEAQFETFCKLLNMESVEVNSDNCELFRDAAKELGIQELYDICERLCRSVALFARLDVLCSMQEEIESVSSDERAITVYETLVASPLADDADELVRLIQAASYARPAQCEYLALLLQLLDSAIPEVHSSILNILFHPALSMSKSDICYFLLRRLVDIGVVRTDELPLETIMGSRAVQWFLPELAGYSPDTIDILKEAVCVKPAVWDLIGNDWSKFYEQASLGYDTRDFLAAIREDSVEKLRESLAAAEMNTTSLITLSPFDRLSYPVLEEVLTESMDIDSEEGDAISLISYAAFCGSVQCVKFLLLQCTSIDDVRSALTFALCGGNTEIIRLIEEKEKGMEVHETEADGYWANVDLCISKFVSAHHSDVVDWIMQHVSDPGKLRCACLCHAVRYRDYCLLSNLLGEEITVFEARLLRFCALQGTNRVAFELMFVPNLAISDLDHITLELAAGTGSVRFFQMCIDLFPHLVLNFDTLMDACMSSCSLDVIKCLRTKHPIEFEKSIGDGTLLAKAFLFSNIGAVQYLLNDVNLVARHGSAIFESALVVREALPILLKSNLCQISADTMFKVENGAQLAVVITKALLRSGHYTAKSPLMQDLICHIIHHTYYGIRQYDEIAQVIMSDPEFDPNIMLSGRRLVELCLRKDLIEFLRILVGRPDLETDIPLEESAKELIVRTWFVRDRFVKVVEHGTPKLYFGFLAIEFAMLCGMKDISRKLLERNDVHFTVNDVVGPLIELGDMDIFREITSGRFGSVEKGKIFNRDMKNHRGSFKLLQRCIQLKNKAMFIALLDYPKIDTNCESIFIEAAKSPDVFYFETLWRRSGSKLQMSAKEKVMNTVITSGDRRKLKLLLERHASWDYTPTMMLKAARYCDPVIFELLLKRFQKEFVRDTWTVESVFRSCLVFHAHEVFRVLLRRKVPIRDLQDRLASAGLQHWLA